MVGIRCWIRASRDAEVRFPSWKISPPCSSSFEVCRWGLKPHGVNILVELSVWGMPSYNREKLTSGTRSIRFTATSVFWLIWKTQATNESLLFTKLTWSLHYNLFYRCHWQIMPAIGNTQENGTFWFMLLGQKVMAATLGSHPNWECLWRFPFCCHPWSVPRRRGKILGTWIQQVPEQNRAVWTSVPPENEAGRI